MNAIVCRAIAANVLLAGLAASVHAQDGMIGFNFLQGSGTALINSGGIAGYIPQAGWNNVISFDPLRGDRPDNFDSTGALVDGMVLEWGAATTWSAPNAGTPDGNLMTGYIDNNGTYPTTFVRVTGVPYSHYSVVAYVGSDENGRSGTVAIAGRPPVAYITNTAPFTGYVENSNVAVFDGLSEDAFLLMNNRGSNNVGLHGFQIIEVPGPPPPPLAHTPATLAAHYSFDDPLNLMRDSRGKNHGVVQGAAAQGLARFGAGSLALDGEADWGEVTTPSIDIKPTGPMAISVWVNRTDASASEVVSLGDHYGLRINADGTVHFFQDANPSGNGWTGITTLSTITAERVEVGAWFHIVAQKAPDHLEVWINGVMAHGAGAIVYESRPIDYANLGTSLFVGRHGNGSTALDFGGQIDELRIYNGNLTPAEIRTLLEANYVPEPTTWGLTSTACLVVLTRLRRRARRDSTPRLVA